ncbi:MAG: hypothetical protein M3417_05040 [Actinomycetota bacterium]|nr:hypothetical protein [Actinomycetota bacterium]
MTDSVQVTDPLVSRIKFDREVADFRGLAADFGRRGWFLVEEAFPKILVLLAAPQIKPTPIVTGVLLDYSDYDVRPPSVRLVDPFTREPYPAGDLPTNLLRAVEMEGPQMVGLPPGVMPGRMVHQQPLMQSHPGSDEPPFLCLSGVREYHDHPAHSGDLWELHRAGGAGRLVRLLEVIDTYGVRPINGFHVNLVPQITGLTQANVPR